MYFVGFVDVVVGEFDGQCYTFPLESEVLRIVPIERIYKAPKYILVLVVTEYKQGCGCISQGDSDLLV